MGYHFHGSQLRVFRKYTRIDENAELLGRSRFILLEHVLPTTAEMILHLKNVGADIFALLAKPYSIDSISLAKIKSDYNVRVIEESYATLENTNILDNLIAEAVEKSREDSRDIVILDVGGYFSSHFLS